MQVRDAVIIILGEQRGHGDNVLRVVVLDGTEDVYKRQVQDIARWIPS